MLVNYNNVDICHDDKAILKGVNLHVGEGEFVYLIGRVGSGKTSLLKTLYAELGIHSGTAEVLGFDMTRIRRKQVPDLRRQLGIVFQDFQLLTDRNVYDNLDFVLRCTKWKSRQERKTRINEVLELVGMTDKMVCKPYELSGGEQQRICIARALLNHPRMILADEATGNLDNETGRQAATILYDVCKQGTTVIMATHNDRLLLEFPGKVYRCRNQVLQECTEEFAPISPTAFKLADDGLPFVTDHTGCAVLQEE